MWIKSVFLLYAIAYAVAERDNISQVRPNHEYVNIRSSNENSPPVPIEAFVTSHKIPEGLNKHQEDEPEDPVERLKLTKDVVQRIQKLDTKIQGIANVDQSLDPVRSDDSESVNFNTKRQARVELENFSDAGVIKEEGIRKLDAFRKKEEEEKENDDILPGVQVSNEYATTMRPVLTTERQYSRSFDFVPVNIIREDSKDSWTPFANRNFDDLGDVSLVPAGSNSRIQIKKGPNGKDYEYEYVYYYYDEEEEPKAGASSNKQEGLRTTPSSRRSGSNSNRSKYSSVDRSTTAEPAINEIIPNKNAVRGRQLGDEEDVSEERLPTNTRFPPRSRSNHNTGTTESTRTRGNRPRPGLDLVDSSSFRTHPEAPEFPQQLPKGPVRFLGVTPNENGDEKVVRVRGRPQKVQEPAPVVEPIDDIEPTLRRRPAGEPVIEAEFSRGQPARPLPDDEASTSSYLRLKNSESSSEATTIETPTTEYPSAMDKVALDLYAFLQQGQNNLVDASTDIDDSNETTTADDDESTTNLPTTPEIVSPTTIEAMTSTTEAATTTTVTTTTSTTTTTEVPTTIAQAGLPGRGKFRRPGIAGGIGTRNRFKSNGSSTPSSASVTEASTIETSTKSRNRFGAPSNGFKRPRPKPVQEEEVQKDNSSTVNAEKPANGRNRYRGTGTRNPTSTTIAPSTSSSSVSSSSSSRPSFNKINLNRRRSRPTTAAPALMEETEEPDTQNGQIEVTHETTAAPKSTARPKLPGIGPRIPRPGAKINLRRPGQTTTSTSAPEVSEGTVEEPTGEGTEEETHETPAETSPPTRQTTMSPLNKLRNKQNRLQVQPKTTTRSPLPSAPRRSPLLPRRKPITEAPIPETNHEEAATEISEVGSETELTEPAITETSTAASNKHEETRGLGGLLAPRRRIGSRRTIPLASRE